jgi:transcriptional regulator with GAF, ATPase, and Fis domain
VLQEKEFERMGGGRPIRTDVRVVTATNRDLPAAIAAGTFRSDLFYRINVFPVHIPPLRERKSDIRLLIEYFIDRYSSKTGKKMRRIDKKSLDHLQTYPWPGNIRELQNIIERSVIVCDTEDFFVDESWLSHIASRPLADELVTQEKESIEAALAQTSGRISGPAGAAARLGMPASTLDSKIKSLRINKRQFQSGNPY